MSLLSHLGDIQTVMHVVDAIQADDAQLHAAHKGDRVDIALPAGIPRIRTASGRHVRVVAVGVVMDDDPRPLKAP